MRADGAKPGEMPEAPEAGATPATGGPAVLGIVGGGVGLGVALAATWALGDLRTSAGAFLWIYGGAFAAYAMSLWFARGWSGSKRGALAVVAAGVVFRAALVPAEPSLSDDIYRYVWDGRVQASGRNPFLHAPASPAFTDLRDERIYPYINNREIRTIYPPVAQLFFLAARGPFSSVLGVKLLLVLFDVGTCLLLLRILARRGRPIWVMVHAWNPLCIVEFAHSGHMDALALFLLVLALERAEAKKVVGAAIALGLSGGAKFFGLAALPFLARRWRWAWVVVPAVLAAVYLPYAGAGALLFDGLGTFAAHWSFNGSAFALLSDVLSHVACQAIAAALLAGLFVLLWKRKVPLEVAVLVLLAALLVTSSTVHPWYVTWLVPLAALHLSVPAIAWSGTVALAYSVFLREPGSAWEPEVGLRIVEYAIPAMLLLRQALTRAQPAPYSEET
jgi:hypothetical protein